MASQLDANQVIQAAFDDSTGSLKLVNTSSLVPKKYDEMDLSYTSGDLTTVVYKDAGVTVATLTLTYDAPGGNVINVVRS